MKRIIVRKGIESLIGKSVSITNDRYTNGDVIVCIKRKNVNYGETLLATNVQPWNDFDNWKKVVGYK